VLRITCVPLPQLKTYPLEATGPPGWDKKILQDNYASNAMVSPYNYDEDYRIMSHATFFGRRARKTCDKSFQIR
jgi:hypothetical protein